MIRRTGFFSGFNWMLGASALLVLLYLGWQFLQAALSIATPFVVGFAFTLLLDPLADRIQARYTKGRRAPAVALVFLLFLICFGGLIFLIVPQLIAQSGTLVRFFAPLTYTVQRATAGEGRFVTIKDDLATTSFTDRGLINGTTYLFRVIAVDANGQGYTLPVVRIAPQARENGHEEKSDSGHGLGAGRDTTEDKAADRVLSQTAPEPSPTPDTRKATPTPSPTPTPDSGLPETFEPRPATSPGTIPFSSPTPVAAPSVRRMAPSPSSAPLPTPKPREEGDEGAMLWRGSSGIAYAAEPTPTPGHSAKPSPKPSPTPAATREEAPPPKPRVVATPGDGQVKLGWSPPIEAKSGFDDLREQVNKWLRSHRRIGPIALPASLEAIQAQYADQLSQALQQGSRRIADLVVGSVSTLIDVVLIPIITFYLLMDIDRLRGRLLFLLPEKTRDHFLAMGSEIGSVFGGYVRGMLTVSAVYGLVAVGVFFACGLKSYALLLGVVAGILYAVPFVGPITTAFLAVVVSLATGMGATHTLIVLGAAVAQNQIFDNIVVPRVVGESVGLHPLITIFALFVGGNLFGIWGMLLSVPIAASIQVVLFRLFPKLSAPTPLALLMPGTRPIPPRDEDSASH